jgi:hypothetical protein
MKRDDTLVVCLSGRGDKDLNTIMKYFQMQWCALQKGLFRTIQESTQLRAKSEQLKAINDMLTKVTLNS